MVAVVMSVVSVVEVVVTVGLSMRCYPAKKDGRDRVAEALGRSRQKGCGFGDWVEGRKLLLTD